jgi:hypothetical protein
MEKMCNCTLITKVEGLESPPTGFLSVIALRLSGDRMGEVSASTHAGRGHNIMMSETNVYIAETNWNYMSSSIPGVLPSGGVWTAMLIFAMNGGSPQFSKLITIPGSVLNQFSMDEHRDHLRVATTYGEMWSNPPTSVSGVYIFNANGEQTGEVTGLAPGERIYSARFEGDKAYVVTFRQVDPLFVLDLRDPTAPIVQGQLKIPGFSNYLHPVNFTHLLGLGHDADLEGRTGGVKISLFNVGDPTNPKEAQSIVIGGKGSSTIAAYDHKSFLFYSKNGLLAFPIEEKENYDKKYDGCLLYNITVAGIMEIGRVDHLPFSQSRWKEVDSWTMEWEALPFRIQRPIYMEGHLITLSARQLAFHRISAGLPEVARFNYSSPVCDSHS